MTDQEVEKIIFSGKSAYTLPPIDYRIVELALRKAKEAMGGVIKTGEDARDWPVLTCREGIPERKPIKVDRTSIRIMERIYQSKASKLKETTTLYQGKFMIVKAENNKLRVKIRKAEKVVNDLRVENTKLLLLLGSSQEAIAIGLIKPEPVSLPCREPEVIKC